MFYQFVNSCLFEVCFNRIGLGSIVCFSFHISLFDNYSAAPSITAAVPPPHCMSTSTFSRLIKVLHEIKMFLVDFTDYMCLKPHDKTSSVFTGKDHPILLLLLISLIFLKYSFGLVSKSFFVFPI